MLFFSIFQSHKALKCIESKDVTHEKGQRNQRHIQFVVNQNTQRNQKACVKTRHLVQSPKPHRTRHNRPHRKIRRQHQKRKAGQSTDGHTRKAADNNGKHD